MRLRPTSLLVAPLLIASLSLAMPTDLNAAPPGRALQRQLDQVSAQFHKRELALVSQWQGPWVHALPHPREGDRFWVLGSSSVVGNLGRLLVDRLSRLGFHAQRHGMSATGFSRPDFYDWWAVTDKLPLDARTAGVLVYMGVNDPQGIWLRPEERKALGRRDVWLRYHEPRWGEVYTRRITHFIDRLCDRGVRRVVILPPADVRAGWLHERLRRIRRLQIAGARASKCGAAVSPAGDRVWLEDRTLERKEPRRLADGYHMSTYGAQLVWQRVRGHLLHAVGGLPIPRRLEQLQVRAKAGHDHAGARDLQAGAPSRRPTPSAPAR